MSVFFGNEARSSHDLPSPRSAGPALMVTSQTMPERGKVRVSARDDYPHLAQLAGFRSRMLDRASEARTALDEIERLRRWKAETTDVLLHWDAVAERFDLSGHLGEFTADAVGVEIDRLRDRLPPA